MVRFGWAVLPADNAKVGMATIAVAPAADLSTERRDTLFLYHDGIW